MFWSGAADVGKAFAGKFFKAFSVWHVQLMKELAQRYKDRNMRPDLPIITMPSYYSEPRDIEVAAIAATLVNENVQTSDRVRELRLLMGESPWRWFSERQFVTLSFASVQENTTAGVRNLTIARLFDDFYGRDGVPRIDDKGRWWRRKLAESSIAEYKKRLVELVLGSSDGFGVGRWTITPPELRCPNSDDLCAFVRMWFPEFGKGRRRSFSFDEAVSLYGFENDADLFYSYLGWQELCKCRPAECRRYITVYQKRYREKSLVEKAYWISESRGICPKVDF